MFCMFRRFFDILWDFGRSRLFAFRAFKQGVTASLSELSTSILPPFSQKHAPGFRATTPLIIMPDSFLRRRRIPLVFFVRRRVWTH